MFHAFGLFCFLSGEEMPSDALDSQTVKAA
jgi:hypothetical protein